MYIFENEYIVYNVKYESRNEKITTKGRVEPEYSAIIENNAMKSSIGPIEVNDCITALLRFIDSMVGHYLMVKTFVLKSFLNQHKHISLSSIGTSKTSN